MADSSSLSVVLKCASLSRIPADPALDLDAMRASADGDARIKYAFTRDNALLVTREGAEPEWFHVRRLPAMWLPRLEVCATAGERYTLAFRAAVHAIDVTGEPLRVSPPGEKGRWEATPMDAGVSLAPVEWVQEIADRFGLEVVHEMGRVAIEASRLPKGARGPFTSWGGTVATH